MECEFIMSDLRYEFTDSALQFIHTPWDDMSPNDDLVQTKMINLFMEKWTLKARLRKLKFSK